MDPVTTIISIALIVEASLAVLAVAYLTGIYLRRSGESRVFRMLIQACIVIVIGGGVIAAVIVGSFVETRLPQPWGSLVVGSAIAAMLSVPIYFAWTIRQVRRLGGGRPPPPFREGD